MGGGRKDGPAALGWMARGRTSPTRTRHYHYTIRPVHLLRVSLLRVLESNFPGDPL